MAVAGLFVALGVSGGGCFRDDLLAPKHRGSGGAAVVGTGGAAVAGTGGAGTTTAGTGGRGTGGSSDGGLDAASGTGGQPGSGTGGQAGLDAGADAARCRVQFGCCITEGDCGPDLECVGGVLCTPELLAVGGVCMPRPLSGECWRDSDCPGPAGRCLGAQACPCDTLCIIDDQVGTCVE